MVRWRIAAAFLLFTASLCAADARVADAAEHKDRAGALALLKSGADADAPQVDGMTALHWAAYYDDVELARSLIAAHAKTGTENRYGVTPLSLAARNGDAAMVKLLLGAGADANGVLPGGETVLMTAARTGKLAAVQALIAGGAEVNRADEHRGQTALMWAAAEGHADVVKALLDAGADLHARIPSGFTAFLFAVREGRMDAVKTLLAAGTDPNETIVREGRRAPARAPRPGTSALLLAAGNAHFELAAKLLDAGADPNAAEPGYTVLHVIPSVRNPGVGDNDPPPEGSGSMTSMEFVKKLVAAGADVNARMTRNINLGNTSLNKMGATPFFLAAQSADAELMRALAALGADPLIPNADGTTPLMAAAGVGTRSPGEDAGTEEEIVEALQVALDLGADINSVDKHGETAMHGAAYKNAPAAVEFLAAKGARIDVWNQKDEYGWTPLIIASGYRFGNFKPSAVTVAAVRRAMIAAGVNPPDKIEAKSREIY